MFGLKRCEPWVGVLRGTSGRIFGAAASSQPFPMTAIANEHSSEATASEAIEHAGPPIRITCRQWSFPDGSGRLWWGCTFDSKVFFVLASSTATESECGEWVRQVPLVTGGTLGSCWANEAQNFFFFENDEPTSYVLEDGGTPEEVDDSVWLNTPAEQPADLPADSEAEDCLLAQAELFCDVLRAQAEADDALVRAIEPVSERSVMSRALQLGLENLRVRMICDAPNIGEHIETTFEHLLHIAQEL